MEKFKDGAIIKNVDGVNVYRGKIQRKKGQTYIKESNYNNPDYMKIRQDINNLMQMHKDLTAQLQ